MIDKQKKFSEKALGSKAEFGIRSISVLVMFPGVYGEQAGLCSGWR